MRGTGREGRALTTAWKKGECLLQRLLQKSPANHPQGRLGHWAPGVASPTGEALGRCSLPADGYSSSWNPSKRPSSPSLCAQAASACAYPSGSLSGSSRHLGCHSSSSGHPFWGDPSSVLLVKKVSSVRCHFTSRRASLWPWWPQRHVGSQPCV